MVNAALWVQLALALEDALLELELVTDGDPVVDTLAVVDEELLIELLLEGVLLGCAASVTDAEEDPVELGVIDGAAVATCVALPLPDCVRVVDCVFCWDDYYLAQSARRTQRWSRGATM